MRARVHADADLALRLSRIAPEHFGDEVVRVADELGLDVGTGDVDAAVAVAQREWMLRWIR